MSSVDKTHINEQLNTSTVQEYQNAGDGGERKKAVSRTQNKQSIQSTDQEIKKLKEAILNDNYEENDEEEEESNVYK